MPEFDPKYRVGRLKGRWVIVFDNETGGRTRYRLAAGIRTKAEAQLELERYKRLETIAGATSPTVEAIWDAYVAAKEGQRVAKAMGYERKKIIPHFGHLTEETMLPAHAREYTKKAQAEGFHDGTIWTELGHLRSALNWAQNEGLIKRAPIVPRPPKPKPRDRWLTPEEAEFLVNVTPYFHLQLAIVLLLATAARHSALLELTWDRVDLKKRTIRLALPDMDRLKGRATVPINDTAMAFLTAAKAVAISSHVIEWNGKPIKSLKQGIHSVRAMATTHPKNPGYDFRDVTPHVMRHTAAVWMVSNGVAMEKVAQYLGHTSKDVTERVYARFKPHHMEDAAAHLNLTIKPLT